MNFLHNDFYQKLMIGTSIAVMIGAVIASRISVPVTPKSANPSDLKKEVSKKSKPKTNPENNLKFKHGGFLSDNDNYLNYSEEEDVVGNTSMLKKSRVISKNPKPFLSDNENGFRGKKNVSRRFEVDDKKMNQFYFALLNKLKEWNYVLGARFALQQFPFVEKQI